jgi:hypothetical protein
LPARKRVIFKALQAFHYSSHARPDRAPRKPDTPAEGNQMNTIIDAVETQVAEQAETQIVELKASELEWVGGGNFIGTSY